MIQKLNNLLSPIEILIGKYRTSIGYFFVALSFLSLPILFIPSLVKETGEQAQNALLFLLFLPIIARVFSINIAQALMPLRKEIGIFMGTLAFVHGAGYIYEYPTFFLEKAFWWLDGSITYFCVGFFALIFTIPLLLTSNNWAIRKLGKKWKVLHRLVYIVLILTFIHVALLNMVNEEGFEYGQLFLIISYFVGKILEWRGVRFGGKKSYAAGQKWICVPCGYIYDPLIGDPDSGIAPGTEFTDIPNSWKCPDCGVSKSDFIPYVEGKEEQTYPARVVNITFLNPSTVELIIETTEKWISIPGQFMRFFWHDSEGTFSRMYSIVEQHGGHYTFTIKLADPGRGAVLLRNLASGDEIHIGGVHGTFALQENENHKIFVATGTGLAPLYHMITKLPKSVKKSLYFSVATEGELFYIEKLRAIDGLKLHIHVTREKVEGYEEGRVDISIIEASPETEWYLCGNPKMVADAKQKLSDRGFENVYSEEFN